MRSEAHESVPQTDAATAAVASELGTQTGLLENIHRHLTRRKPEPVEYVETFVLPAAASSYTLQPGVPTTGAVEIEAWQSSSAPQPLVILDGDFTQAQALAAIPASGYVPALTTVPAGHNPGVRIPGFSGYLTVVPVVTPTAPIVVTVKVREC